MFAAVTHDRRRLRYGAAFLLLAGILSGGSTLLVGQTAEQAEASRKGKEMMAAGRYSEAIPTYRSLVGQIPGNIGLLTNLAMAEALGGDPKAAVGHCEQVLKQNPQSVPALNMLAMSHLQLGQPGLAILPLRKLTALTPENANVRGMLAGAEMSLQHFENAMQQYSKLTSMTPGDAKAWFGLGKSYESLAAAKFNQLAKAAPQSAYLAVLLGETRFQRRQYRSAFFFYREAEKQMPQLAGVHGGLASVYDSTGHADWAAQERRKEDAITANCLTEKTEPCRYAKGELLSLIKTTGVTPAVLFWATRAYNQLALKAFQRLGELPESTELHALKAQIMHDHGQDLDATKEWEAALKIAPEEERPRLETELATAYFLGKDYAHAIPMLEGFYRQNPRSADLNFMLGESLWRTQKAEEAIPYLERAIQSQPDLLAAHAALGLALAQLNKPAEAISHLEKAQDLDDDGSLHYSLARAYLAAGSKDKASQSMEAYRKIQQKNAEVNGELAKEAEITAPSS